MATKKPTAAKSATPTPAAVAPLAPDAGDASPPPPDAAEGGAPTPKPLSRQAASYPAVPTKRAQHLYRRYEAMGQARTLRKLAQQIVLEDWASEHYYRQQPKESMDTFYRRLMKEVDKAGQEEQETLFRHRANQLKALERWSRIYHWVEKAAAFDQEQVDLLERETLMARIEMNKRQAAHAALLHQMSGDHARKLLEQGEMAGRDTVQLFLGAATQERVALGASTSIQEQRGKVGIGVSGGVTNDLTVHQDVQVSGDVTIHEDIEHRGQVALQVTQLNVDMLRLLQGDVMGAGAQAWRAALGLGGTSATPALPPSASPGGSTDTAAAATMSQPPSYQSLGAWITPAAAVPPLPSTLTTPTMTTATTSPRDVEIVAPDDPDATSSDAPTPPNDGQQHIPLRSSDLASVAYDAPRHTLEIAFHSGAAYQYQGVPHSVYEALVTSDSPGAFFHARIKDAYLFERVA